MPYISKPLNIVLVGDPEVGKTTLISKCHEDHPTALLDGGVCRGFFTTTFEAPTPDTYKPTALKTYSTNIYRKPVAALYSVYQTNLIDTGGAGMFDNVRPLAYMNADVFIICFDIANGKSFQNVKSKWFPEVNLYEPAVPKLLVGLKKDLGNERDIEEDQATTLAAEQTRALFMEASSLDSSKSASTVFETAVQLAFQYRERVQRSKRFKRKDNTHKSDFDITNLESPSFPLPPKLSKSTLTKEWKLLLDDQSHTDVTLKFLNQPQVIKVHSFVLAAMSAAFREYFLSIHSREVTAAASENENDGMIGCIATEEHEKGINSESGTDQTRVLAKEVGSNSPFIDIQTKNTQELKYEFTLVDTITHAAMNQIVEWMYMGEFNTKEESDAVRSVGEAALMLEIEPLACLCAEICHKSQAKKGPRPLPIPPVFRRQRQSHPSETRIPTPPPLPSLLPSAGGALIPEPPPLPPLPHNQVPHPPPLPPLPPVLPSAQNASCSASVPEPPPIPPTWIPHPPPLPPLPPAASLPSRSIPQRACFVEGLHPPCSHDNQSIPIPPHLPPLHQSLQAQEPIPSTSSSNRIPIPPPLPRLPPSVRPAPQLVPSRPPSGDASHHPQFVQNVPHASTNHANSTNSSSLESMPGPHDDCSQHSSTSCSTGGSSSSHRTGSSVLPQQPRSPFDVFIQNHSLRDSILHNSGVPPTPYLMPSRARKVVFESQIPDSGAIHFAMWKTTTKESLLGKTVLSDVTFVVEGTLVFAHRVVLVARSRVMAAMLDGKFKEKDFNKIELPGVYLSDFLVLLRYIYTDECKLDEENVRGVLVLADRLCVDRLAEQCEAFIVGTLSRFHLCSSEEYFFEQVLDLYTFAKTYNALYLVKWCLHVIATNYTLFEKEKDFKEILAENREYIESNRWLPPTHLQTLKQYKARGLVPRLTGMNKHCGCVIL